MQAFGLLLEQAIATPKKPSIAGVVSSNGCFPLSLRSDRATTVPGYAQQISSRTTLLRQTSELLIFEHDHVSAALSGASSLNNVWASLEIFNRIYNNLAAFYL